MNAAESKLTTAQQLEEDLKKLQLWIRQLKIQYDIYFAGGMKRPPKVLQSQVKKLIKRYGDEAMPKYHHRFMYNQQVSRYNLFAEQWAKRIRMAEEGPTGAAARRLHKPVGRPRDETVARCTLGGQADQAGLVALHNSFEAARRKQGDGNVSYERFLKAVNAQASRLRKKNVKGEIELRVVVSEGKVELRARVRKPTSTAG